MSYLQCPPLRPLWETGKLRFYIYWTSGQILMFRSVSVRSFAEVKFRVPPTLMTIEICDISGGRGEGVRRALYISLSLLNRNASRCSLVCECKANKQVHSPTMQIRWCVGSATQELVTIPTVSSQPFFNRTWRKCRDSTPQTFSSDLSSHTEGARPHT